MLCSGSNPAVLIVLKREQHRRCRRPNNTRANPTDSRPGITAHLTTTPVAGGTLTNVTGQKRLQIRMCNNHCSGVSRTRNQFWIAAHRVWGVSGEPRHLWIATDTMERCSIRI